MKVQYELEDQDSSLHLNTWLGVGLIFQFCISTLQIVSHSDSVFYIFHKIAYVCWLKS